MSIKRKVNSCGAILYSYDENGDFGLILGKERICDGGKMKWYPFKGCSEEGETLKETAIREVFEETGGLVKMNNIDLYLAFTTPNKNYYIGLYQVPYSIVDKFNSMNRNIMHEDFKEKEEIRFFSFFKIKDEKDISDMTKRMLRYFETQLNEIPKRRILPTYRVISKAPIAPWART